MQESNTSGSEGVHELLLHETRQESLFKVFWI
jgi:hypothetical protein